MRLAACALLLVAACGPAPAGTNANPVTDASYYPLAEGNTWNYRVTLDDGTTEPKVHRVVGRREWKGDSKWVLESVEGSARTVSVTDYSPQNGVRRYRDELFSVVSGAMVEANDYDPFTLRLPPLAISELDESYTVHDFDGQNQPTGTHDKVHRWTVVSRAEEVTVPAGTFRTLHVRRLNHDGTKTRDYWMAAGVGKVKETGDFLEELVSYDLH